MNASDEEWGEEALIEAVHQCRTLHAPQMLARLMGEAEAFAAGAPQHDDMTVVALRIV